MRKQFACQNNFWESTECLGGNSTPTVLHSYSPDLGSLIEQILINFGGFYAIKINLLQTVLSTSTPKYQ